MSILRPTPKFVCNTKISVHHWQLLDLLHYESATNRLYYTKVDEIRRLEICQNQARSERHFELKYLPKCSNVASNGVTVTGGVLQPNSAVSQSFESLEMPTALEPGKCCKIQRPRSSNQGLFSYYSPETGAHTTVKLGEMINNDVKIYDSNSSQFSAYACNNDSFLYCMDVNNSSQISVTAKINCELNTCLNNVIRNPMCHRLLTVSGDTSSIFMVDPSSPQPVIKTIDSKHDSGFGIAYHNSGTMFSSVFQDGSCLIYDIRNLSGKLAEIRSTRPGISAGALRLCKFSPGNTQDDLLVLSEHAGRVHLVDMRHVTDEKHESHQVIVLPGALEQYADFMVQNKRRVEKLRGDDDAMSELNADVSVHDVLTLYNDQIRNYPSFSAPLVYCYDYLINENPQLFKNYYYQPPPPPPAPHSVPPRFKSPQWSSTTQAHVDDPAVAPKDQGLSWQSSLETDVFEEEDEEKDDEKLFASYVFHERSYSTTSADNLDGEMLIAGLEYYCPPNEGGRIVVGTKSAGLIAWEVNAIARRGISDASLV
ncbi:hypothetical protein DIURU_001709 [Diutina rugosa]|uniref:DUF2415 domain-containing protein n=1 Tax=Diutina rugosa TaxID=5481 RepID=A0A642UTS4_DIURU|nr:uncharacterized protein DIURU_001709 [Diutina rugosa]KAA8905281.1 hypothetical protein DIURU_001709 [Diutina rugosa]